MIVKDGRTLGLVFLSILMTQSYPLFAADPIAVLHFDTLPAGSRIDEEYASDGVHFINDYQLNRVFRSSPRVEQHPNARTSPNVLVNTFYDAEFYSSRNVPMAIWFDKPVTGVGMWLGTTGSSCGQSSPGYGRSV